MSKETKIKKAPVAKKKPEKKSSNYSALSAEYVLESDDENSDKQSESGDESLPEYPADVEPRVTDNLSETNSESSSEEESESEGRSEDDEEEDSPKPTTKPVKEARAPPGEPTPTPVALPAATPYKPPLGFESSSVTGDLQVATTFKKSNLEGKQIWYFTAPASVPISALKATSLAALKNGEKVVSHDNLEYGFMQDTAEDRTYTKIMVPNSSDDGYKIVSKPMDQILHLQQIVQLPGAKGSDASCSKATAQTKKFVRPQPPGLKMRFLPIGFGTGDPGKIGSDSASQDESTSSVSDEEMEEAPKPFQTPTPLDKPSEEPESESDEEMTEPPPLSDPNLGKIYKKKLETPAGSQQSLKRKHADGLEKKFTKTSSLQQSDTIDDHKKPKRQKTKQTGPQGKSVDTPSASTKISTSIIPPPPLKSILQKAKPDLAIPSPTSYPQPNTASSPANPSKKKEAMPPPPSSAPVEKAEKKKQAKPPAPDSAAPTPVSTSQLHTAFPPLEEAGNKPNLPAPASSPPANGEEKAKKKKKKKKQHDSSQVSKATSSQHLEATPPASSPGKPATIKEAIQPPASSAPNLGEEKPKKKRKKHEKDMGLSELTKATDPNLTAEERRKKLKKLTKKDQQESQSQSA